jgi:hypothetical protein
MVRLCLPSAQALQSEYVTAQTGGTTLQVWLKKGVPPEHPEGEVEETVLVWIPFWQPDQSE